MMYINAKKRINRDPVQPKHRINVLIHDETYRLLKEHARDLNESLSLLVSDILKEWIERYIFDARD